MRKKYSLPKGVFTISIDYESALGFADFQLSEADKERMRGEVDITARLLQLFERYNIPATWAVVGHLLEEHCTWNDGMPHPEYPRPIHKREKRDWFALHPPKDEYSDPLWFDVRRLIPQMVRSSVGHEVASHSYAHIIYGARDINKDAVRADIENVKRIHNVRKYPLYSFVFPRNREAHHTLLRDAGVRCYRGTRKTWYSFFPGFLRRGARLKDYYLPSVRTVLPQEGAGGLINIPDSLMLLSRHGLRRVVTPAVMKWKIRRGIRAAAKRREVFHLWFHPSNFWFDDEMQFSILEDALHYAALMRERGNLEILTMRDIAEKVQS